MYETVIEYQRFGEPSEVLRVERRRRSDPGEGEIRTRLAARVINPSDLIPIRGAYAHRIALPAVPGYEGVGVVEAVGAGVSPELLGRRVLPLRGQGTWQSSVISPAAWAVAVPSALPDAAACQMFINPVTAWVVCTEVLKLQPGDVLLMNAGGSSLAAIAAQLSSLFGFRLIAVTRNPLHRQRLMELGAWHVLDGGMHSEEAAGIRLDTVRQLTAGKGAAAAIDCVGGRAAAELAACTATGGTLISLGLLSGDPIDLPLYAERRIRVQLFHLRHWMRQVSVDAWQQTFAQIIGLLRRRRLTLSEIEQAFRLRDVLDAVRAAERPGGRGKMMLTSSG